jgi:hypothetical protein
MVGECRYLSLQQSHPRHGYLLHCIPGWDRDISIRQLEKWTQARVSRVSAYLDVLVLLIPAGVAGQAW